MLLLICSWVAFDSLGFFFFLISSFFMMGFMGFVLGIVFRKLSLSILNCGVILIAFNVIEHNWFQSSLNIIHLDFLV